MTISERFTTSRIAGCRISGLPATGGPFFCHFSAARRDGFNAVIFVVPWAAFQPTMGAPSLCPIHTSLLVALCEEAQRVNLRIILRVGFLWESDFMELRTFERYERYEQLPDSETAWKQYHREDHQIVSRYSAYLFSFLSWEDFFWPRYRCALDRVPPERLLVYAQRNGFFDWAARRIPQNPVQHFHRGFSGSPLLRGLYLEYLDDWIERVSSPHE